MYICLDNTIRVQCFFEETVQLSATPPPLTIRQYSSVGRRAAKQRRFLTKSLTHSEKIFLLMKSRNAGILSYSK